VDVEKDEIINTLHFDSETGMPQPEQEEDGKPVARMVVYEAVTN